MIDSQETVNKIYYDFNDLLKTEMKQKLRHKQIHIKVGQDNKRRRIKKPWWNDLLTIMWNEVCYAEKNMIKAKGVTRKHSRQVFKDKHKIFDREVQRSKRNYVKEQQREIENLTNSNQQEFWKKIGKVGIGQERQKLIPMEVLLEDGSLSKSADVLMNKWKTGFYELLDPNITANENDEVFVRDNSDLNFDQDVNSALTRDEVVKAIKSVKNNKANDIDNLLAESLKTPVFTGILTVLFNKCFNDGIVPDTWKLGAINPIPKSSAYNKKDPLSAMGITLAPVFNKIYCTILNNRLSEWEEQNNILHDAQNGFRKKRSTVDHITSLTSIIETRKLKRKSTFAIFVDFKNAYDAIDRSKLFIELKHIGIAGRMYKALVSLYEDVKCCVRVNSFYTVWFSVSCGLKQGCCLSPILFNFISMIW